MSKDNNDLMREKDTARAKGRKSREADGNESRRTESGESQKKPKKEKKKKGGFFGRKKQPDFDESEDTYYGIQLKPIDEYAMGLNPVTGEFSLGQDAIKSLFEESKQVIDDEVEKNFERLQAERRRRVAEAVRTAGINMEDVEDELGIIAPIPVSAVTEDAPKTATAEFHRAAIETATESPIKIQMNIGTDEAKAKKEEAPVSEESVAKILEKKAEDTAEDKIGEVVTRKEAPQAEVEKLANVYEYRRHSVPTHVIRADILQSAILSESELLGDKKKPVKDDLFAVKDIPEQYSNEEIDDYTSESDAPSVSHELRSSVREMTLRTGITGICMVALILINIIFSGGLRAGTASGSSVMAYIIISLVVLAASAGFCVKGLVGGLKGLMALRPDSDSAAAVAVCAAALQGLISIFYTDDIKDSTVHLYAVVASGILFANHVGKLAMIKRIHSNFRFLTSREQKYTVDLISGDETAKNMVKDAVIGEPVVAYHRKTTFLKRFLELSYLPDRAEEKSWVFAPVGLVCSLVLCIITMLLSRSVPVAVSAMAAGACTSVAVSNMMALNIPVGRLCRRVRRSGAFAVGSAAIEKIGKVKAVVVEAKDIFPIGTVVLSSIKTFGSNRSAEEAVMNATAVVNAVGGPMAGAFEQIMNETETELPHVTKAVFEDGLGIVGEVKGKKIYIGNRELLINNNIEPCDRSLETEFAVGNRQIVYVAVEDALELMMVVAYSADRRKKNELQRLEDNGISICLLSRDVNISSGLMAKLFAIDASSVTVMDAQATQDYRAQSGKEAMRDDAIAATKGRVESMMNLVSLCVHQRRNVSIVLALQNAAVVIGFILVAFMACFGGMRQLDSFVLFVFELFWVVLILAIPKIRKP